MMENTDGDDEDHGLLIPGDVLIQILVWLPVISLLRFKSVCKTWRALIESSFFTHLHDTTATTVTTCSCSSCSCSSSSSSSNKFGTFIFHTSQFGVAKSIRTFMLKSSRRRSGGDDDEEEVFEVEDLGFPPLCNTDLGWWKMVGSCNGLICSKLERVLCLWNPATKQFRLLPKSIFTLEDEKREEVTGFAVSDSYSVFGFGFDAKTKDYKVVQIRHMLYYSRHAEKLVEFRVQVYSLSTDSWRVFFFKDDDSLFLPKQFKGYFDTCTDGIYLNGSFFFHGTYRIEDRNFRQRHWIVSFDFTKEIFTPIKEFPNEVDSNYTNKLILTYFGTDKIAFLEQSHPLLREEGRPDFVFDIWVLNNEHDDQEKEKEEESYYCWTKLQHSIRRSTTSSWIFPKVISGDGEFALIETRRGNYMKLQLVNLVTNEKKTVHVYPDDMGLLSTGVYKPSLVSIIGGGGNGNGTAACSSS